MLHGGTLVSYISNEGGVAVCMERLENQRTAIRRLQVRTCRTENMECGKELDMQNETDKQILSTLNQDNFRIPPVERKQRKMTRWDCFTGVYGPYA